MQAPSVMMSGRDTVTTRGRTVASTKAGGTTANSMVLVCLNSQMISSTDSVSGKWVNDYVGSQMKSVTQLGKAKPVMSASSQLSTRKAQNLLARLI